MGPKMRAGIEIMQDGRVYTSAELNNRGIDKRVIKRLKDDDIIASAGRGRYFLNEEYVSTVVEENDRALYLEEFFGPVASGGDQSVVCLLAAATWHDLGVDRLEDIHVGVPWARGRPVAVDRTKFIRWRQVEATTYGVELAGTCRGLDIQVTDMERTIVDLLRYSPLNGRTASDELLIDEESVTEAIALYKRGPDYNPSKLLETARKFGVEKLIDWDIKASQKFIDSSEDEDSDLGFRM